MKACCDWSEFSTTLDSADVCGAERGDDQTPTNVCVGGYRTQDPPAFQEQ